MIHVALSLYDKNGTYARHAGVLIASILRNTTEAICFHILCDDTLTEVNRRKLEETYASNAQNKNGSIRFVDMYGYLEQYQDVDLDAIGGIFTRGALYRLCLPEALADVDEVIYLDCDIVVNLDINLLWNERLRDGAKDKYILAGVREYQLPEPKSFVPRETIKTDKFGLSNDRYINSGVLLMNLEKIRSEYAVKNSLLARTVSYLAKHKAPYPDQDFLNAEYINMTLYVDGKYNEPPIEDYEDVFNVEKIFHFYAKGKPWNLIRGSNADMLYWTNLTYTPWRGELIESFYKAASEGEFYHRHSRACVERLIKQLKNNIRAMRRLFKK